MGLYKRGYELTDGRASYTWNFDFTVHGRRYRGSFGHVTATTAKALYARERTNALDGHWQVKRAPVPRLREFFPEFLTWYASHASTGSVDRYRYAARVLLPALGILRLSDMTDHAVDRYVESRYTQGRAGVTINREVGCLTHLLRMAVRWKRLSVYPLSPIKRQRELSHERILTAEEEDRLLASCGSPLREVIQVALDTGFRESEVVALRRPMVNLRENLLTVPSAYAKIRETRTVEMTARVRAILESALIRITMRDTDRPLLGYLQATSVKRAFRRAADRVGLTDVRFHDLRHTFGTRLLLAGIPLVKVQRLMGHKTVTMTMRYLALTDGDLKGVILVLEKDRIPSVSTAPTDAEVERDL